MRRRRSRALKGFPLKNVLKRFVIKLLPFTSVIVILSVCLIVFLSYLYHSPQFKVTGLQINDPDEDIKKKIEILLQGFIGRNIFECDLVKIKNVVLASRPYLRRVIVMRRLPNTIVLLLGRRKTVAQIDAGRFYTVDEDTFILQGPSLYPFKDLTIIEGIVEGKNVIIPGKKYESVHLKKALEFFRQITSSSHLAGKGISRIDISSLRDILFWVDGVEVRFGEMGELDKKLALLKGIIKDVELKETKPKYIDLRFENPVIGTK